MANFFLKKERNEISIHKTNKQQKQMAEATQMFINRGMDFLNGNEILFSLKKKNSDICYMNEPWRYYFKWNSSIAQSCLTLCNPMDCSLPGSSIYGIFQARVLEWVAISFSRGSSRPRNRTRVSCIVGRRFTVWPIKWNKQVTKWQIFYDSTYRGTKEQSDS